MIHYAKNLAGTSYYRLNDETLEVTQITRSGKITVEADDIAKLHRHLQGDDIVPVSEEEYRAAAKNLGNGNIETRKMD